MVARAVPGCWDVVAPETLCRVRAIAAAEALGEVCGVEARSALLASLPLLRRAVAGCDGAGRVMAGANRSLWPRIATALGNRRARRGLAGLHHAARAPRGRARRRTPASTASVACEAHVLAAGTKAIPAEVLRDNRGWSEDDWEHAAATLHAARACCTPTGGSPTPGAPCTAEVEELTDELAEPAYAALSDPALGELPVHSPRAPPTWPRPGWCRTPTRWGCRGPRAAARRAAGGGQPGTSASSLQSLRDDTIWPA